MFFEKTILVRGLLMAFGGSVALLSTQVQAQDAGTTPGTTASETQRVIVTGSNIRRTDSETPAPVQVITAEEIKASGYTSIQDVLQNITANGQGTLSQGFSGAFASGAAGISLRGLNTSATLVLIDGHRSAPYPIGDDGQRSFVDIANIPFDSVERIEVLKDGASAIYGSDAIAGVVNIILKRSYTGGKITADVGTSWKNDGATRHASGIYGLGDLDKDGYNAYISGEIRKQDQIRYADRGGNYTNTDFTRTGGYNVTPGVPNTLNQNLPASSTGYITDTAGNITGFMPGCNATSLAAGQCAFHNTWSQLQPATENYNVASRFTKALGGDWQASLQATYFESKAEQVGSPGGAFTGGYQGITSGPGVTPTLLPALGPTTIPSTNPSYPAGAGGTSGLLTYTDLFLGPTVTKTDARTTRLVADVGGSAAGWDLTGAAGYTQVRLNLKGYNSINAANLQTALDSTTDPFLVGQPNSAAVDNFIAPVLDTNDTSKLIFFQVNGSHDLFALPGGEAQIALGADYVHRTQDSVAPAAVEAGQVSTFSNNFTIGTQNVGSVHAELSAPILKTLEADAALRYDHYNLSGGKASPEAGFKWTPTKSFALRGTAAKGFRAPGPAENGTAGQTFFAQTSNDPILCPNGPTATGAFPSQCGEQLGTVQSTTKTLKPETSTSYTLGIVLEPVKDLSATLDFYSIKIKNQIVADTNPADETTVRGTNLTPIPQVQADGSTALVAPPVAPIAYLTTGYINANQTETSGLDADLTWRHKFEGVGEFKSDFMVTWMASYDQTIDGVKYHLAGTHGPLIVGGDTGSPRTRINWANTISRGAFSVTGTLNYISGYGLTDPSVGVDDCLTALTVGAGSQGYNGATSVPPGVSCRVGSFYTFDLEGHYDVNKHLTVNAAVLNLFNNGAPLDWATYGGGTAPYNPSLHQQGAIGRYMTVGASYTF
jgi:iron complex outermembrane receptor protein